MKKLWIVPVLFGLLNLSCGASSDDASDGAATDDGQASFDAGNLDLSELEESYGDGVDAVVRCMADEGFQFNVTPEVAQTNPSVDPLTLELTASKAQKVRAETSGFGISRSLQFSHRFGAEGEQDLDENDRYELSLDGESRQRYNERLYGANSKAQIGCVDLLEEPDDSQAEFQSKIASLFEQAVSTSALDEFQQDWSACMADEGYPGLFDAQDAEQVAAEKIKELLGPKSSLLEVEEGGGWLIASDGSILSEESLKFGLDVEVAIATASVGCRISEVLQPAIVLIEEHNQENNLVPEEDLKKILVGFDA